MKRLLVTLALSFALPAIAIAQTATDPTVTEDRSVQDKKQTDPPANTGGATANPTAKPADSSISEKQKTDAGAASPGGTTATPTAKPADSSVTEKQKKDQTAP